MHSIRTREHVTDLVLQMKKLSREAEWIEFKVNYKSPDSIGEYVSALANGAALSGKQFGYLVWGVADDSREIVGTRFDPMTTKIGNEELENWLLTLLSPRINFRFYQVIIESNPVVLLEIERASTQPVRFRGQEFIRIGSYKKKLKDFPEKERQLWRSFDQTPFEKRVAMERVDASDVLELLDYPSYFDMLDRPLPRNRNGILSSLAGEGFIHRCDAGRWNVTNLACIVFAKRLEAVQTVRRKAVRVIQYQGESRLETLREKVGGKGYAPGFDSLIGMIDGLLPQREVIEYAIRRTISRFPEAAVRELVANAMIHQDFFVTGAGPTVEIFENRIEITNPGGPLVDARRFVDCVPKSRNEALASIMRRVGICEERGSGWDKVASQCELHRLPAPLVEVPGDSTRVVLFSHRTLAEMSRRERVATVYLHACLQYVNRGYVTNASLRKRLGIEAKNSARASRLIAEAVDDGVISPEDPAAARRLMRYMPWWAKPDNLHGS